MWNKYCKKLHPLLTKGYGASHAWKKIITARDEVEHNIWWQIKAGSSIFRYNSWTKQGALYYIEGDSFQHEELEVNNFSRNGEWDKQRLLSYFSEEMVDMILEYIKPTVEVYLNNKPWWMGNTSGSSLLSQPWRSLERKKRKGEILSSFGTRDYLLNTILYFGGREETMTHVLLTSPIAFKLWRKFAHFAAIIMWILWKRRNTIKHDGSTHLNGMVCQVQQVIKKLIKTTYPWIKLKGWTWEEVVDSMGTYRPKLHFQKVLWKKPDVLQLKCNIDGACRGNPGMSSYGFFIRDDTRNLVYARAKGLGMGTNAEAEAIAVKEALDFCYEKDFKNLIIETDSLGLRKMIIKQWKVPWQIVEIIEDIRIYIHLINATITHTFRKGNTVADSLANEVIESKAMYEYHCFQQLPVVTRRLLNIDKDQIPNIRIKTRRIFQQ
ncbi:hypothetical protein P3L10_026605 [Capsicum annuum]